MMPKNQQSFAGIIMVTTNDSVFELSEGANLLDALIENGCTVDYQCRSGYCGTCRVRIVSGEVSYHEVPIALLNDDEILPCCCRVTQSITLDV